MSTNGSNENRACISIVDMDPPLPVIKEQKPQGEDADSLWKRRSGGVALKTLQLQQIHHPRIIFNLPPFDEKISLRVEIE